MIHIKKEFPLTLQYNISLLDMPKNILFFDIETTGLSAFESALYLIGAVHLENGRWFLEQWFVESLHEEAAVLRDFFEFTKQFRTLLHFNGDMFDIRYLSNLSEQYYMEEPLSSMKSVDIYKRIRKKKALLGLPGLRQKSIEHFLGIGREDMYNGGELIAVYEEFQKSKRQDLLKFLLLHNEEDLMGMPKILPILSYADVTDGLLESESTESVYHEEASLLEVRLTFKTWFPVSLKTAGPFGETAVFSGNSVHFQIPAEKKSLLYFYPNYKDYYYLPKEDTAIHKKLAAFVDKEYRQPATRDNCYTRLESLFVPALTKTALPVFFENADRLQGFSDVNPETTSLSAYLKELMLLLTYRE